jgi:hypothetical protein
MKLTRMGWEGHVTRAGRGEACTGFWWKNVREIDHWGDPGVDGRIILSGSSVSEMWGYGLDWAYSG